MKMTGLQSERSVDLYLCHLVILIGSFKVGKEPGQVQLRSGQLNCA